MSEGGVSAVEVVAIDEPCPNAAQIFVTLGTARTESGTRAPERLEKTGLVEHAGRGKWTVVDPAPNPPGPQGRGLIEPFSGARVARHAADGRVRDELTMA